MQTPESVVVTSPTENGPLVSRRLRSLVLAWHDEETGDELTIDVRGSERFLKGLRPLGFVPVEKEPRNQGDTDSRAQTAHVQASKSPEYTPSAAIRDRDLAPSAKASLAKKEFETADHRVRWTVRLARPWKPKSR